MGTPLNHSSSCYFEGIVTNVFTLSSVFWCVLITFLLNTIVNKARPFEIKKWMHLLCWGLPVLLTLLPFTKTNYGIQ